MLPLHGILKLITIGLDMLLLSLDENATLHLRLALREIRVVVYQLSLEYSEVTINT